MREDKDNVRFPICPINLYFEGDEEKCDTDKCNWDIDTRSCSEACRRPGMKLQDVVRAIISRCPTTEAEYFAVAKLMVDYCEKPATVKKIAKMAMAAAIYEQEVGSIEEAGDEETLEAWIVIIVLGFLFTYIFYGRGRG